MFFFCPQQSHSQDKHWNQVKEIKSVRNKRKKGSFGRDAVFYI